MDVTQFSRSIRSRARIKLREHKLNIQSATIIHPSKMTGFFRSIGLALAPPREDGDGETYRARVEEMAARMRAEIHDWPDIYVSVSLEDEIAEASAALAKSPSAVLENLVVALRVDQQTIERRGRYYDRAKLFGMAQHLGDVAKEYGSPGLPVDFGADYDFTLSAKEMRSCGVRHDW